MTLALALQGLVPTLLLALAAWLASLPTRDVSLVDRYWSWMVMAPALYAAPLLTPLGARGWAVLVLGLLWAIRLSAFISWRNWGHGEDKRYVAIRRRNEPGFAFKSLYLVFALQAVLAWIVALPLLDALGNTAPLNALNLLGVVLAAFGLVFETVADSQMARFRARPQNQGQVMDRGLWRYSRHPNYFGETCFWWGLWLVAPTAWGLLSPVLMTVLLLKVSGVTLLEQDIGERRPEYRDYQRRTNAFIPGPRRPA